MADAIVAPVVAPAVAVTPAAPPAPAQAGAPTPTAKADASKAPPRAPDGKFQKADALKADMEGKETDQAKPSKHKITVDGQDEELDIDELIRRAQKATAADKRFREADETRKSVAEQEARMKKVLQAVDDDPLQFADEIKKFGKNPRKLAEAILAKELESEMAAEEEKNFTPEQKRMKELEKRVAEYERAEAAKKAEAEQSEASKKAAERASLVEQHTNEMGDQVLAALKSTVLPQTPETALELVNLLEESIQRGLPVKPEHLARELEARKLAEISALLERADDSGLTKLLPKTVQERLNRATVQAYKKDDPLLNSKPMSAKGAAQKTADAEKPAPRQRGSLSAQFARLGFQLANGTAHGVTTRK